MRALRYDGPGMIEPVEMPDPVLGPHDVLLRPLMVGICFTDKLAHGSADFQVFRPGTVLGHEFCGRVEQVGGEVGNVVVGDLVAPDPRVFCGSCLQCEAGYLGQCSTMRAWVGVHGGWPGALADLVKVPARSVYLFTPGLSHLGGACAEPFAFAVRQIRHVRPAWGDNVVVLGVEDYGLVETGMLAATAGQLVVVDPHPLRRAAALRFGAHHVLDAGPSLVDELRTLLPHGADLVVVNAEAYVPRSQAYLAEAYEIARPGATVLLSRSSGGALFPGSTPEVAWAKELEVRYFGACFGEEPWRGGRERGDWQVTLEGMQGGRLDPLRLEGLVVPFEELRTKQDVNEMMHLLPAQATKIFVEVST